MLDGKFFRLGGSRWPLRGLTYGPFAPGDHGHFLPSWSSMRQDLRQIRGFGANAIRVYHVPPRRLLDEALEAGLRVLVDVPWEKHRCFFEDWDARRDALDRIRTTAIELGDHPALFAVSVANEFPNDIVRFYGHKRVERFVDQLVDVVKQERPECLVTFANYPPTEFLCPERPGPDFLCFNVYLNDPPSLGAYIDRLQHLAGHKPLILGEFGMDSIRQGEAAQAEALSQHVRQVFRHGLAGSFVFSYTDDWYTGGHQIDDWAFGITDAQRREKPSAVALRRAWVGADLYDPATLPKASVVVCSYNGATTLEACLHSLTELEYPDYEVILVDDGSTDDTPDIASRFPTVKYVRQQNAGLSAARNVGANAARGEIVAYTDSDCVADPHWLVHLISAMRGQDVEAIGGPNIPPPTDGWTAKCVAVSPGAPSHVMLDDHRAEHVPGCNMAFDRRRLLEVGAFDPQFRQAGDDVDICWRFTDAGLRIGFAPAAVVWHHRRNTVRAYLGQQKGYGRSEAMLQFKHPQRFNRLGCSCWAGVIYGEGAVGLPVAEPEVYHGPFGTGLFQTIYRHNRYSAWAYCTTLEWHAVALFAGLLGVLWPPLFVIAAAMWTATILAGLRSALKIPLPPGAPRWCKPLVVALHLLQPIVRGWHRRAYRLSRRRLPRGDDAGASDEQILEHCKPISWRDHHLYFDSRRGLGREHLLRVLVETARRRGWNGHLGPEWKEEDGELVGDAWHDVGLRVATEELGSGRRFTRVRCSLRSTGWAMTLGVAVAACMALSLITTPPWEWHWSVDANWRQWVAFVPVAIGAWFVPALLVSRRRCRQAVSRLTWESATRAGLDPVPVRVPAATLAPEEPEEDVPEVTCAMGEGTL